MQLIDAAQIETLNVRAVTSNKKLRPFATTTDHPATANTFEKLAKWGWFDGIGRSIAWRHWQRQGNQRPN